MLGKVVLVAGAGAAYLLRTRSGQEQYARLLARLRAASGGREQATPTLVDRRPQALENRPSPAPLLLPDATPTEIARAVLADPPRT